MARFTTNIEREKNAQTFNQAQQFLWKNSLQQFSREQIEAGIEKTVSSMEKLLATNTITQQRMPNSENRLYLELVERVQEEQKFKLINVMDSKVCHRIVGPKPTTAEEKRTELFKKFLLRKKAEMEEQKLMN